MRNEDHEAIHSEITELSTEFIQEFHGVDNSQTYLARVSLSTYSSPPQSRLALWGDVLCIKWFAKWISIPIQVWSLTKQRIYLHFNPHIFGYQYNILFHDQNTSNGHYEPILSQLDQSIAYPTMPLTCHNVCQLEPSNIQKDFEAIDNALSRDHLIRCQVPTLDCRDSFFHSICLLVYDYDMVSLRKCASQTFCNAYLGQKKNYH